MKTIASTEIRILSENWDVTITFLSLKAEQSQVVEVTSPAIRLNDDVFVSWEAGTSVLSKSAGIK